MTLTTKQAVECSDCPPDGYPTDATRCAPCPRRAPVLRMPRRSYFDRLMRPLPSDKRQEQKVMRAYSKAHLLIERKDDARD